MSCNGSICLFPESVVKEMLRHELVCGEVQLVLGTVVGMVLAEVVLVEDGLGVLLVPKGIGTDGWLHLRYPQLTVTVVQSYRSFLLGSEGTLLSEGPLDLIVPGVSSVSCDLDPLGASYSDQSVDEEFVFDLHLVLAEQRDGFVWFGAGHARTGGGVINRRAHVPELMVVSGLVLEVDELLGTGDGHRWPPYINFISTK